jgi:hypothetical protein
MLGGDRPHVRRAMGRRQDCVLKLYRPAGCCHGSDDQRCNMTRAERKASG